MDVGFELRRARETKVNKFNEVLYNASFHNRARTARCAVYPSRPSELFCEREEYFPCNTRKRGAIVLNGECGKGKSGKRRNEQTRPKKMDRPVISPPPTFRPLRRRC